MLSPYQESEKLARELELQLGLDFNYRMRLMTLLIAVYKSKELAIDAYTTILQDASDIEIETKGLLGPADV
jgi:hypothetical protein